MTNFIFKIENPVGRFQWQQGILPHACVLGAGFFVQFHFCHGLAHLPGLRRVVVLQIFFEDQQCVGVAAVQNLLALEQAQKAVAGAPLAVTGRAKARHMPLLHEPAHRSVQRAPALT